MSKILFPQRSIPWNSYFLRYTPANNSWQPWPSVADANAGIPVNHRHAGMMVNVSGEIYFYKNGVQNEHLVLLVVASENAMPITGGTTGAITAIDIPAGTTTQYMVLHNDTEDSFQVKIGSTPGGNEYAALAIEASTDEVVGLLTHFRNQGTIYITASNYLTYEIYR